MDVPAGPAPTATDDTTAVAEIARAGTVSYDEAMAWFAPRKPAYIRLAQAVAPYVRPDGMVLDIGANIGYFTKILGETLGLTGTVHLYEPVPNLAALCRVTASNLPFETVVHEYGLSDEDAEIEIFTDVNGNLGWNTIIAERADGMTSNKIQVRKFVPEALGATPAFVKIDVEGAESKVLNGMIDAFATWSPRPPVLCEIGWGQGHPHWQDELAVFTRLLDLGYHVVDLNGKPVDITTLTKTSDVIFLPEGVDAVRNISDSVTRPAGPRGPIWVHRLGPYTDERGNSIEYNGTDEPGCKVKFTGSNNSLVVADGANIADSVITFDCDNGEVRIGANRADSALRVNIRVGQDGRVLIGRNASATTACAISAAEGATVTIGEDVMFASDNALRADDGHPIFDVRGGKRVNPARPITVGNHVWLGKGAVVLGGATVGDGSVIGYGSVVTKSIPNNCVAAGIPARIVRRHIAWERPHLTLAKPYYKPDGSTVVKSRYWHLTDDSSVGGKLRTRLRPAVVRRGLKRRARKLKSRLNSGNKGS